MAKRVLVCGGAGYVGAHTCQCLAKAGYLPVVFDNLSNGHRDFVQWGPLEVGDIRDTVRLDEVFKTYQPEAVLHFAALIEVDISISDPAAFYDNNVAGSINLINTALCNGVDKMVFSSTCAIYGAPQKLPISEGSCKAPLSPYGRSKWMVEQVIKDLQTTGALNAMRLRYFNAAGADLKTLIGERHNPETHVIPLAISAAMNCQPFQLYGDDYDTHDGSALRDYVHVADLANAHRAALEYLLSNKSGTCLNLGSGHGVSVLDIIHGIEKISGKPLAVHIAPKRHGDSPALIADTKKATKLLNWTAKFMLPDILQSAWNWHKAEYTRTCHKNEAHS